MKAGHFCAVLGAFAVISTTASAQVARVESTVPVVPDSAVVSATPAAPTASLAMAAVGRSSVGVQYTAAATASLATQDSTSGGIKNFLFGTQRRKSTTFLVGGVALAGIGVGVVKGHPGAIMGVAGLLSCIAGMYYLF